MSSSTTASLPLMLKQLRLASIKDHWQSLASKAIKEHWNPGQYLAELCSIELSSREDKRLQRYLKEACLPPGKQLSSFDFDDVPGVTKQHINQLLADQGLSNFLDRISLLLTKANRSLFKLVWITVVGTFLSHNDISTNDKYWCLLKCTVPSGKQCRVTQASKSTYYDWCCKRLGQVINAQGCTETAHEGGVCRKLPTCENRLSIP